MSSTVISTDYLEELLRIKKAYEEKEAKRKSSLKKYHNSDSGLAKRRETARRHYWMKQVKKYHPKWNPDGHQSAECTS